MEFNMPIEKFIRSMLFLWQMVKVPLTACYFIELLSPAKAIFG